MIKYNHLKNRLQKSGSNPTLVCWLAVGGDAFLSTLENNIESLLKNIINDLGYEIYDVQYSKEGKNNYLRIFIDKDGIIDINDCEKVNNAINDILDEADLIKEAYFLEVSSPGLERNLRSVKHFEKQIEKEILVKVFKPVDGKKEFIGILKSVDENNIVIQIDEMTYSIDFKNISMAKTIFDFKNID